MATKEDAKRKFREWRRNPLQFAHEVFSFEPDEWQKEALASSVNGGPDHRLIMKACTGPGKQNKPDDIIETTEGFKTYRDLRTGDFVYDAQGNETEVLAKILWRDQRMYRITFRDKTHIDIGANHMWKVFSAPLKSFRYGKVVSTQDMVDIGPTREYEDGRVVTRFYIQQAGPIKKSHKNFPIDPYVLGCWLGDGCRETGLIVKDDIDLFKNIKSLGYSINFHKKQEGAGQRANIIGLRKALGLLGIGHLYSPDRYIPKGYLNGSINQRLSLLRGLLDTDGRIKTNGMVDFHSTSKELIDGVAYLVRSLGGQAVEREVDTHRDRDCYSLGVVMDVNPFSIERKASRWKKPPEWKMRRHIQSIEELPNSDGYCIEVDNPEHLYQANYNIVTHNSAILAIIGWHRLACFAEKGEHPKGAALSITKDNLSDNLWSELSKWQQRSEFLKQAFTWTKSVIYANDHPETWFLSARSFAKDADQEAVGRSLSGLHSKFPFILLDETGDMPQAVGKAAEQIFTGMPIDALIAAAGNPTSVDGLLYLVCEKLREGWEIITITADPDDKMRTPRVSVEHAQRQIKLYGRDNPWVMATILGLFPPGGFNNLLTLDEVEKAFKRFYRDDLIRHAPRIIGVDVAREGDDQSVIFQRQGLQSFEPKTFRNIKSTDLAGWTAQIEDDWRADGVIVDGTGGYGASLLDALGQMNRKPHDCQFASKATNSDKFYNKRAEIWWEMAEWIKDGGAIPDTPGLLEELTQTKYAFKGDRIIIEPKDELKARLGRSPDCADALAVTFAFKITPKNKVLRHENRRTQQAEEWSPYDYL